MLLGLDISAHEQFPDKDTGQHGQEISHVERHDRQHPTSGRKTWRQRTTGDPGTTCKRAGEGGSRKARGREEKGKNVQKITDSGHDHHDRGPRHVDAQSPREGFADVSPHDANVLLDAGGRDEQGGPGAAIFAGPCLLVPLPGHDDVSSVQMLVEPSVLHVVLERHDAAEDDGEHDQEDACPRVARRRPRRPALGEQGRFDRGEERHGHAGRGGRRRARGVLVSHAGLGECGHGSA